MQHLQAKNDIALTKKQYLRGVISYGELLVKLGSILIAFQIAFEKENTTDSKVCMINDWGSVEPYMELQDMVKMELEAL